MPEDSRPVLYLVACGAYPAGQLPAFVRDTQAQGWDVCVIATPNGGGFGGKSDIFSHELVAAKLAIVTGRPVKITLTREEVFYAHRGRHPVLMKVKTGFTKDGRVTAVLNYLAPLTGLLARVLKGHFPVAADSAAFRLRAF